MSKIWSKNKEISKDAETFNLFTTGNDYALDQDYFMVHDIIATKAHALTLAKAGIITDKEYGLIATVLGSLLARDVIAIEPEDEDCHTVLERILVAKLGDLGKKIHTGRSRNDQSLTMIRLFMHDSSKMIGRNLYHLYIKLADLSNEYRNQIFIGYSHTQQAMLTTLGHYYNSFHEQFLDDSGYLHLVSEHIHQNPLGSGAGFGSPINLDRQLSSDKLGFNKVQKNSLYCQNSRGKFELMYLSALSQIMLSLQRFATDMIMYTTREFSFFDIDDTLAQGSSMMPQKRNLDVFEIIRAKSAEVMSLETRVQMILKGLPSGYNRDLQLIKNAIVEAHISVNNCLGQACVALDYLKPNDENIRKSIKPDIYSTDVAIIKCLENPELNFRDVYNEILNTGNFDLKPEDVIKNRKSLGSPGNY